MQSFAFLGDSSSDKSKEHLDGSPAPRRDDSEDQLQGMKQTSKHAFNKGNKTSERLNSTSDVHSAVDGDLALDYSDKTIKESLLNSRKRRRSRDSTDCPTESVSPSESGAKRPDTSPISPARVTVSASPGVNSPQRAEDLSVRTIGSQNPTSSAVKDLENVMNKHLPAGNSLDKDLVANLGDYHDNLKQKSTIQWIGNQSGAHTASALTASALLRQIYSNRESVIRSNVHLSRPGFYSDMQSTLPTPPGSEGYSEQAQFAMPTRSIAHSSDHMSYSTAVSSFTENYTMTPPGSVSPHDKLHSMLPDSHHYDPRHYVPDPSAHLQHLPLKPQLYMHPSAGVNLEQYPTHLAAEHYPHGAGFHLYHSAMMTKPSDLQHGASAAWYSQSGN